MAARGYGWWIEETRPQTVDRMTWEIAIELARIALGRRRGPDAGGLPQKRSRPDVAALVRASGD